ncbi:hypothetical protein BDZ89DRAFT_449305 [Hymenopellis radicata]|nr:hypothetical protein BDZ89DRAFT_449305 [Hymenopellis radicata]
MSTLVEFFPALAPLVKSVDPNRPEDAFLPLPSRLSPSNRNHKRFNLQYATEVEYGLRKVQAHAILTEIRGLIILQVENLRAKKEHLHGQGATTRAHRIIQRFEREKKEAMIRYNFVRARLLRLGLPEDDTVLRHLEAAHMAGKDATKVAQPGEARMGDSWLWAVSKPGGLTAEDEEEWYIEMVSREGRVPPLARGDGDS